MKITIITSIVLITFTFFSCNKKETEVNYNVRHVQKVDFKLDKILLDSIKLDSINSSYMGHTAIFGGNIYFVDSKFCYVYKFDKTGKFIKRFVGQGGGENELPVKTITLFAFLPNGNTFFMGPTWDCFLFDSNFKKIDDYAMNWHPDVTKEEMLKKPDGSKTQLYSVFYIDEVRATNNKIIFPIVSQHPTFNPTTKSYAKEARVLGQMDLNNGYVNIYGRYPPLLVKNLNSMIFGYPLFDFYNDNKMVLTFGADPYIYIIDDDFKILSSFGQSGKNMDTIYTNAKSPFLWRRKFREESDKKGYYSSLKYVDNLLFRTYHKSNKENGDGLQIYSQTTLIADINVPKDFKIEGYIAPYFYSTPIIDADKGLIKIYKFKLN